MISASLPPARHPFGLAGITTLFRRVRSMHLASSFRDMAFATLLVVFAAAIVHADEQLQDWIPEVLTMPDDVAVVNEREIGSTIRMLSISTNADVDALFEDWEESLRTNGYLIQQGEDDILDRSIEFSGNGIGNAKIIVSPTEHDGRHLIEFDATLD